MAFAKTFRDLIVYQRTVAVELAIFTLSREFPTEERFSLVSQIRRSSRSIGAQIAEAWGKRRYPAHFVSKLTDGDGEQLETQHWLDCAGRCEYITPDTRDRLLADLADVGRMLNQMIAKADSFCLQPDDRVHESAGEYFASSSGP